MNRALLLTVLLALTACTPFHDSTEAMFKRHPPRTRDFPASGVTMAPLGVGQWSLYRSSSGAGFSAGGALRLKSITGFERLKVTDSAGTSLRMREWDQNEYQKVFTAAWVPGNRTPYPITVNLGTRTEAITVPWPRAAWAGWGSACMGFSGLDCAYQCLPGGSRPESTNRPEGLPLDLRAVGAILLQRYWSDPNVQRSDVTTPAGTFHGAIQVSFSEPPIMRFLKWEGPITLWLHPAVPIDGVVRADIPQGGAHTMLELVDFGP